MGTQTEDADAEKAFEADMANTQAPQADGDVLAGSPNTDEAAEKAFESDMAQSTALAGVGDALEPKQLETNTNAPPTATAAAAAADPAIADGLPSVATDDATPAADTSTPLPEAQQAHQPNDDGKPPQTEFAFEDPAALAKSMKEDWGEDGWEDDIQGVDYLGADIDDDDESFARAAGSDYLDDGNLLGGEQGAGGVGLPEDDDSLEADPDLLDAEWEYDALNDVDGGEDDDVDNIAEAFAQGELDKSTEGAEGKGMGGSQSTATAETNLDKSWGSGWAMTDDEMDGSVKSHIKAASKAIKTHVDVKQAVVGTQQRMKLAVANTMGLDPTAKGNQLYLTLASLLPVVPIVFLAACVARVIKETITMYRAVQIANVYCASFCGMLVVSGLFTHSEPLASYQFLSGNSKYVQYQLVVLFVFALYLILVLLNTMANAFWWPNTASLVCSLLVGIHYYFGVWHPAMLAQPPQPTWGLREGSSTYTVYMCLFAIMALVPPKDAEVFHAFEDKEKGAGKAQD